LIVESTKLAWHGALILGEPSMRVHVIHLVRDSRAFAYSRVQRHGMSLMTLRRNNNLIRWFRSNVGAELLRLRTRRYMRIRYEDFTADPHASFDRIGRFLGRKLAQPDADNAFDLDVSHQVGGSRRSRLSAGRAVIAESAAWRTELRPREAVMATLVTWPALLRYGYPIRFRDGMKPAPPGSSAGA
jgi:hypothetical protein